MEKKAKKKTLLNDIMKYRYSYVLLLPAMVLVLVFSYAPMLGISLAFKDYDVFKGFADSPWVGFKHFVEVFSHRLNNTSFHYQFNI